MCNLTKDDVLERLRYEEETGKLFWLTAAKNKAHVIGNEAGRVEANGYRHIALNGKLYSSHRLIWLMHHGKWPAQMIDHIDGNKTNNRLSNLRDVDAKTNNSNRHAVRNDCKSGAAGVYKQGVRWYAYAYIDGVKHSLGGHESIGHAIAARAAFKNGKEKGISYV